jgi:hypothetical protein
MTAPNAPTDAEVAAIVEEFLICKGGAYYRPNAEGYTRNIAEAGRYTLAEAISHSHPNGPDGPRDGITYEAAPISRSSPMANEDRTHDAGDLAGLEDIVGLYRFDTDNDRSRALECLQIASIRTTAGIAAELATVREELAETRSALLQSEVDLIEALRDPLPSALRKTEAARLAAERKLEAAVEQACAAVRDRLYPRNPESDWTEFAAIRAGACISAEEAIRSSFLATLNTEAEHG